jgi:hypothetical protein
MKPLLSSPVKIGLAALCLAAGLAFPASAAPMMPSPSLPAAGADTVTLVRDGEWRGQYRNRRLWLQRREAWRRDHWRPRYREDWRYRRPHYRGSGIYFGLGLGVPAYRYRVEPRRYVQPQRLGNAHVRWCYARYRSYRAWDNTFQPYNGPRRQCWSPYS